MPVINRSEDEPSEARDADSGDRLRAIGAAVGITVAAIVVSVIVGVVVVVPLLLLEFSVESTPAFLALTAVGQFGLLAVGYVYARRRGLRIRAALPGGRGLGVAVAGTVVALALATALGAALRELDLVPTSVIGEAASNDPTVLLGLAVLSVFLVAPAEEFLFRGVVQGRLREVFGPAGAVAGSSLLFGSIHLANYTGRVGPIVAGALLIAATGAVLGTVYELTDNLAVPIAVHAVYNAVLAVGSYVVA